MPPVEEALVKERSDERKVGPETERAVVEALVTERLVDWRLLEVRLDTVVVAKVEVPVTERVPCDVIDVVATIVPPVIEDMLADTADRSDATRDAIVVVPVKVLLPEKVCVPVETTPREDEPASGMLRV
jgi:hypothetical protein